MTVQPAARLASLAAFSCLASACGGPIYGSDGQRTYSCYSDAGSPDLTITFSDGGRTALVTHAGRKATLSYQGSKGLWPNVTRVDSYESYKVLLTLDPEANLIGLTPERLGPCQSE